MIIRRVVTRQARGEGTGEIFTCRKLLEETQCNIMTEKLPVYENNGADIVVLIPWETWV